MAALEDYHPPTDLKRFPRKNLHCPTQAENGLGYARSYKFSTKDEGLGLGRQYLGLHCCGGHSASNGYRDDQALGTRSRCDGGHIDLGSQCRNHVHYTVRELVPEHDFFQ